MSDESVADGLSRRSLLKRGAVVGAAAVWTVPLVQAVSMSPAHADSPSGSGGGGGNSVPTPPPASVPTPPPSGGIEPASVNTTAAAGGTAAGGTAAAATDTGSLAFTGTDLPVGSTLGVGAAALALGAGALVAGAAIKRHQAAPPPTDA